MEMENIPIMTICASVIGIYAACILQPEFLSLEVFCTRTPPTQKLLFLPSSYVHAKSIPHSQKRNAYITHVCCKYSHAYSLDENSFPRSQAHIYTDNVVQDSRDASTCLHAMMVKICLKHNMRRNKAASSDTHPSFELQ